LYGIEKYVNLVNVDIQSGNEVNKLSGNSITSKYVHEHIVDGIDSIELERTINARNSLNKPISECNIFIPNSCQYKEIICPFSHVIPATPEHGSNKGSDNKSV
jgi:hypothetical protein